MQEDTTAVYLLHGQIGRAWFGTTAAPVLIRAGVPSVCQGGAPQLLLFLRHVHAKGGGGRDVQRHDQRLSWTVGCEGALCKCSHMIFRHWWRRPYWNGFM